MKLQSGRGRRTRLVIGAGLAMALAAGGAAVAPAQAQVVPTAASGSVAAGVRVVPASVAAAVVAKAALSKGLSVTIAGLPASVGAKVVVTGPKQTKKAKKKYAKAITRSTLLKKLAAGAYKVTATRIVLSTGTWNPTPTTKTYQVKSAKLAKAAVTYRFTAKPVPPSTQSWNLTVPSNPITATVVPDTARAVTTTIPRGGGTMTAVGADGVTYTLTVPPGALLFDTAVTMTPLAAPIGVPMGSTSYGVSFAPDGLQFYEYASLALTPAAGMTWPIEKQTPIGIDGVTRTIDLTPMALTAAPVLKLKHFSSYALLLAEKGMSSSLTSVRNRIGADAARRFQSAIAERIGRERQSQLLGNPEGIAVIDAIQLIKQYYEDGIKPELAAAKTSCAIGQIVIQEILGLDRQAQFLGYTLKSIIGIDANDAISGSIGDMVAIRCMQEEYEICRDEHIVTRILPVYIGFRRQLELAGGIEDPDLLMRDLAMQDLAAKCLTFRIGIETSASVNYGFPTHTTSESMSSIVEVKFTMSSEDLPPDSPPAMLQSLSLITGPLVTLSSTAYGSIYTQPCYTASSPVREDGSFGGWLGFSADENSPQRPGGANYVKDFAFSIVIAPTLETSRYTLTDTSQGATCTKSPPTVTTVGEGLFDWAPPFLDRYAEVDNGVMIRNWNMVGNADIMATKTVSGTVSLGGPQDYSNGTMTFTLFHKPAPN